MSPSLSIVIPVLNRAALIGRAIDSVKAQGIGNVEIIVVDGGSSDGTQEIVRAAGDTQLIDAPGSSIYAALNIGVRTARGDIIGHLNSDDRYLPNAFESILASARNEPSAGVIRGLARYVAQTPAGDVSALSKIDRVAAQALDLKSVTFGVPAINACFICPAAYRSVGLYDETYRIAADRDWLMRALLTSVNIRQIDSPVYEYLVHTGSLTMAPRHRSEGEYAREHLSMAAGWLATRLDPKTRRILLSWHAQEMVRHLMRSPLDAALLQETARAFRRSPGWPLWSIAPLARIALRRLTSA